MTKSTKIIAALGVAAGLGIAALPAGAFAVSPIGTLPMTYPGDTSEDVTVKLRVESSLALGVEKSKCIAEGSSTSEYNEDSADWNYFTISDTGSCAMKIAGGSNADKGFVVTEVTKDTYSDNMRLAGVTNTTATDQNQIKAVSGALNTTAGGWNISGGMLDKAATSSTAQNVMITKSAKQVEIPMTYNFATRGDQEAGEYSTVITYTIAANDAGLAENGIDDATQVYPPSV